MVEPEGEYIVVDPLVLGIARPILEADHRRHLSRFLSDRRRKR